MAAIAPPIRYMQFKDLKAEFRIGARFRSTVTLCFTSYEMAHRGTADVLCTKASTPRSRRRGSYTRWPWILLIVPTTIFGAAHDHIRWLDHLDSRPSLLTLLIRTLPFRCPVRRRRHWVSETQQGRYCDTADCDFMSFPLLGHLPGLAYSLTGRAIHRDPDGGTTSLL